MQAIELTGTFAIPAHTMWLKWTEPELMMPWFQPGDMFISQVMRDLRTDGRFCIKFNGPDGSEQVLFGKYTDVIEQQHLAFTWQWQDEEHVTRVDLCIVDKGANSCEIQLRHDGFWDQEDRDLHEQAWITCLEKLSLIA